jgi:hypothetical protein
VSKTRFIAYAGILVAIFAQLLPHIAKSVHGKTLNLPLAVYSSVMFALGTMFLVSSLVTGIDLFIDYRNYPGGPAGYATVIFNTPVTMLGNVMFIVASWLADGLMVSGISLRSKSQNTLLQTGVPVFYILRLKLLCRRISCRYAYGLIQ